MSMMPMRPPAGIAVAPHALPQRETRQATRTTLSPVMLNPLVRLRPPPRCRKARCKSCGGDLTCDVSLLRSSLRGRRSKNCERTPENGMYRRVTGRLFSAARVDGRRDDAIYSPYWD